MGTCPKPEAFDNLNMISELRYTGPFVHTLQFDLLSQVLRGGGEGKFEGVGHRVVNGEEGIRKRRALCAAKAPQPRTKDPKP